MNKMKFPAMKTRSLRTYPLEVIAYVGANLLSLGLPLMMATLIDRVLLQEEVSRLGSWSLIAFGLAIAASLASFYWMRFTPVKRGIENTIKLQAESLRHVLRMNAPSFEKKDKGYYYNVIMNSTANYGDIHSEVYLRFAANLICVALLLTGALVYKPMLALLFALYIPLLLLLSLSQSRKLFHLQKDAMEKQDGWLTHSKNIIESKRQINALQADSYLLGLFKRSGEKWLHHIVKYRFLEYLVENLPGMLTSGYGIAFLAIGARSVLSGSLTPGELVAGYQYLSYLALPVAECANILMRWRAGGEHMRRVDELEELAFVPKDTDGLPRCEDVLLRAEHFHLRIGSAPEENLYLIESLSLARNEYGVIKGANGSGKSMLFHLMTGQVNLAHSDGDLSLSEELADAAQLMYPSFFLDGTLRENLFDRSFDPELLRVLNIDFADKGITSNPVNLSLGQQQKLALLRVLSMDKPILLLDEPFTNLDLDTQRNLIHYFQQMKGKKTILFIMHDDSLDFLCDQVLVIEDRKLRVRRDLHEYEYRQDQCHPHAGQGKGGLSASRL
ncbi:ABC transporter ATP-binding protein [Gorillibacterium sp. CAU 1737]|uniref:ABC transporter ATP-binding protein n=1 Tax=Gorillibacterium sp. CAU 1737 TaxID=3140362 RepID=UPI00326134EB